MPGSAEILINVTDLDSGNDGNGTGGTPTTAPGAVDSVPEGADVAAVMFIGEADTTAAVGSETLATIVQVSVDGGSTWGPIATFRTITASEIITGSDLDESAGDPTFRRAIAFRTPKADSGQAGLVQLRTNTVASHGSNQMALFVAIWDRGSVRDVWYNDAQVA
jgi:hypothetical protein